MLILPVAFVQTHRDPKVLSVSRAFTIARMAVQLSQKAIAIDTGLDAAHLSKQIHVDGLNLHRLVLLDKLFWRVFLPLLADIVDCADLLVNPIAGDVARQIANEIAAMHAELAAVHRELIASQREKVTA